MGGRILGLFSAYFPFKGVGGMGEALLITLDTIRVDLHDRQANQVDSTEDWNGGLRPPSQKNVPAPFGRRCRAFSLILMQEYGGVVK